MKNPQFPIHFVDIETTHFDWTVGEIIEICIWTSRDGGQTISNRYHTYIQPEHLERANPRALEVNGYTDERWSTAPKWVDVCDEIFNILEYGIFCAHNVNFDWYWLDHHIQSTSGKKITWRKLDTQSLVWEHIPTDSASMSKLRTLLGWSHHNAHTAQKDVEDLVRLYKMMIHTTIGHVVDLDALKSNVEVVKRRGDDHMYITITDIESLIKMITILNKNATL
jgi:DNA polymerase III subunit epsilon